MAFEPKYLQPKPLVFSNPLKLFLGKEVVVETEGYTVEGKLLRYELPNRDKPHRPNILIVQNGSEKIIIRGNWVALKTERLT